MSQRDMCTAQGLRLKQDLMQFENFGCFLGFWTIYAQIWSLCTKFKLYNINNYKVGFSSNIRIISFAITESDQLGWGLFQDRRESRAKVSPGKI